MGCFSKSETGVAALAHLKHLAFDLSTREREPLVADDPAADPYGAAFYKAARLAVRPGEAGERDQVDYPDLLLRTLPPPHYQGRPLPGRDPVAWHEGDYTVHEHCARRGAG